jgi:hypothetical protein
MNVHPPAWAASVKLTDPKFADRLDEKVPAETLVNEYHDLLDRAISIVASKPFLLDARRDGHTYHHLQLDHGVAVLTWTRRGEPKSCHFPSFLLDLDADALHRWQAQQGGMIDALLGKAAE